MAVVDGAGGAGTAGDQPAGVRALVRRSAAALVVLAAVTFAIGLTEPVVALYALELDATPLQAALVVAVRWMSRLVTNVPAGAWSDRHGRRVVVLSGSAAIAGAGAAAVLAADWRVLLAARLLEGLGAGALLTALLAAFSDMTDEERGLRGRLFGWYQMIHRLGFWLGPAAGAVLYAAAGGRAVMASYAALSVAAVLAALRVRETRRPGAPAADRGGTGAASRTWTAVGVLLRRPAFLLAGGVALASFFTLTGAQFTAMPVHVVEIRALGAEVLGLSMLLINAVGFVLIYPSARAADRYGRRWPISVLSVTGAAGLLLLARADSVAMLLWASVLLGATTALRGPALQAFAMDAGGAVSTGVSAGVFRALADVGSAAGPLVAGVSAGAGPQVFFAINALLLALFAVAFLVSPDVRRHDIAQVVPAKTGTGRTAGWFSYVKSLLQH